MFLILDYFFLFFEQKYVAFYLDDTTVCVFGTRFCMHYNLQRDVEIIKRVFCRIRIQDHFITTLWTVSTCWKRTLISRHV